MNEPIEQLLASREDWSGYRLADLREGLGVSIIATLQGPIDEETIAYWAGRCEAEIDFLIYMFALTDVRGAVDDPAKNVDQLIREWVDLPLSRTSRGNLRSVYLNTYFFKYIATVELPKLHAIAATNPRLTLEQCIDFYITQLLYDEEIAANPGTFFTYEQIAGVDARRIAALQETRRDLTSGLMEIGTDQLPSLIEDLRAPRGRRISEADTQKLVPVFSSLYLLMTYYVGSNYRRVHAAVTALLDLDMAELRSIFFQNLPSCIERKGALVPQVSLEATLADVSADSPGLPPKTDTPHSAIDMCNLGEESLQKGDPVTARAWFQRSADLGNADAMIHLGVLALKDGDRATGRTWFTRAADLGNADAMYNLGQLADMDGDRATARTWWTRAAELGQREAMYAIGHVAFDTGDRAAARTWWTRAAELGETSAMCNLGVLAHQDGDRATARAWLTRAAELGNAGAMAMLEKLAE